MNIEETDLGSVEKLILGLIARGKSDPEIAADIGLDLDEVRRLHSQLSRKLSRKVQRCF